MAISNAVSLANFTSGDALIVDSVNDRVGIASTVPTTTLDVDGDVKVSGVVTATSFVGDGTNITNAGSTLNVSAGDQRLVVTSQTTGSMTQVGTTGDLTYNSTTKTLSAENVSIGGTLTYEDVTNVDSIGVITARTGINVLSGGISAVGEITSSDGKLIAGVGIRTEAAVAGYAVTFLDLRGAGVSTVTSVSSGIVTAFFEGGGGGSSFLFSYIMGI